MKQYVVDASVVAAAFFKEEHADRARSILTSANVLQVPDLIYAEIGNVIWKRHGRGEIDDAEAAALLEDIRALPFQTTSCEDLVASALALALRTKRTVYDSVYLALAVATDSVMVTGDKRLFHALSKGTLAKHLNWIGDKS